MDSRSTRSASLVDDSASSRRQTISRAGYDRVAARQDDFVALMPGGRVHTTEDDLQIGSRPGLGESLVKFLG